MLELKVCAPTPGRVFIIVVIVVTIINLFGGGRGGMTALEPVWKSTGFSESTVSFNSVGPRDLIEHRFSGFKTGVSEEPTRG